MAVRRESVVLDLDDRVTPGLARIAAAAEVANRSLQNIGGSNTVSGIDRTNSKLGETEKTLGGVEREALKAERGFRSFGAASRQAGENDFSKAARGVDDFLGKVGTLPALAAAGTAALVPLAAAAAGVVAAFAAPIAFSGGAVTLFGFLGGAAISQTQKQYKSIDELQKKLAGLTKGTAQYAQVQKQLAAAQQALSPQQRAFHNSLETLKSDFAHLINGPAGQDLLGPFTKGLQVADDLLPKSAPLIHAVAGALTDLLGELDKYANTPGFNRFIHEVARTVGPDLRALGHIVGDVAPGLGNLLLLLDHRLSAPLIHDLEHMAQSFGQFASSKQARHDVEGFISYFNKVGPDAAHTVEAVARGAEHFVRAVAPLGPDVLHVVKGIADGLSSIPTPVLTDLAKAAAGLVVLQKFGGFKVAAFAGRQAFGNSGPLGGGGILGGGSKGGVVPVYVTNKGFGAPGEPGFPGEPGKPGSNPLSGAGNPLKWALPVTFAVSMGAAIHQAAYDAARSAWGQVPGGKTAADLAFKIPGQVGFPGFGGPLFSSTPHVNPVQAIHAMGSAFGWLGHVIHDTFKPIPTDPVKSLGTHVEALHASLAKASRDMDLVGHSADRAFNGGASDVVKLSGRLQAIKTAPAQQQLELIGTAAQRGFTKASAGADQLQGKVNGLHGKQIDVTVNGGQSLSVLRAIAAQEAAIRSKTVTLTTIHATGGHSVGNADGGTIGGSRYPYGDKVLSWLAPGEEVISNRHGQADRHRSLLRAINAGHMASGGTVGADFGVGSAGAGSAFTAASRGVRAELRHLKDALASATKELDTERQARQNILQQRSALASAVQSSFRSQFLGVQPNSSGIWAAGAGGVTDPLSILRSDIHGARQFRNIEARLRRRGLHGAIFGQIQTLAEAQQLDHYSNAQLRELQRLYTVRQHVSRSVGHAAGDLGYGAQLERATKAQERTAATVRHLEHELQGLRKELSKHPHQTGQAVGKAVNHASGKASRRRH